MYWNTIGKDEVLTKLIFSFLLLLGFAIPISWKLVGVNTFDSEMIVYLICGSFALLYFLFQFVMAFRLLKKPHSNIVIDLSKKIITIGLQNKQYSLNDVLAYAYSSKQHQMRLYFKNKCFAFSLNEMENTNRETLSKEDLVLCLTHSKEVHSTILYNYPIVVWNVLIGFYFLYVFWYGKEGKSLFNMEYIPTYFILIGVIIFGAGFQFLFHKFVLKKISKITSTS
jgi:hypothetical protein